MLGFHTWKSGKCIKCGKTIEGPSNRPDVAKTTTAAQSQTDEKSVTDLLEAAAKGDLQSVKAFVARGVSANASHDGRTALLAASLKGHAEVVKALLEAGADAGARDRALFSQGADALYLASQEGHTDVVKALLSSGAQVDAKEDNGWTALLKATQKGYVETVRALLDYSADVNARAKDGACALLVAAQQGHGEIVSMLLDKGADMEAQTHDRSTALIQAAQQGHVGILRALLAKGAKVNTKRNDNVTALYLAAYNGHADAARVLLDAGADVNVKTNDNVSALYSASGKGHTEIVQALLKKGADVNARNTSDNWTALIRASQQGHLQIVKMLLNNGADVSVQDADGWTASVAALKKGHTEVVKLLENGSKCTDCGKVRQELKKELLDELHEQLGSFAVNLVYMRTDDEANATKCFEKIVSQGSSAPCTAYAVVGELRSGNKPGLFVGVVLHHWTLAALRQGSEWFLNVASKYVDMPDAFVEVKDKNYAELDYLPFSFYKFKKVASSAKSSTLPAPPPVQTIEADPVDASNIKRVSDALSRFLDESEDVARLEQVKILKEMGQQSLAPLLYEAFDEYGDPSRQNINIYKIRVAVWCGCALHPKEFDHYYRTQYRNGRSQMLDEMRSINMKDGMSGQTYVHRLLAGHSDK
jgi:uncharacterized protein